MNESVEKRKFQRQFLKDLIKGIIINYLETVGRNGYLDNLVLCTYVAGDDTLQSPGKDAEINLSLCSLLRLENFRNEFANKFRSNDTFAKGTSSWSNQPHFLFVRCTRENICFNNQDESCDRKDIHSFLLTRL